VGEGAAAREYFTRSLQSWKNGPTPDDPRAAVALRNLGLLEFVQGDRAAARNMLEQALARRLRSARDVLASLSEAEALRYASVTESVRDPLLSLLRPTSAADAPAAYRVAWQTRALVTRAVAARRDLAVQVPEARPLWEQLRAARSDLARLSQTVVPPSQEK